MPTTSNWRFRGLSVMQSAHSDPLIDVLLPVRAPAPWLTDALESVRNQSISNWRLIVVMDGFSQDVKKACGQYAVDGQLHLEELPPGSGLVSALNRGVQVSRAEFIARLDADDVCHPDRLRTQYLYMKQNPACLAVGTGIRLISQEGEPLGTRTVRAPGSVLRRLRWRSPIAHPSVMLRSRHLRSIGGYSARSLHAEDFDLWLRLGTIGEIHAIPPVLLDYRLHDGQVTDGVRLPASTRRAIADSRLGLARARGESVIAARTRHALWVSLNKAKGR